MLMQNKEQFYEKYINGIKCTGFHEKENREKTAGEVMVKVYEVSEKIRKLYAEERKAVV